MKTNKLPYSLSEIYLDCTDGFGDVAKRNISEEPFDLRSDFILSQNHNTLYVVALLTNDRCLASHFAPGIRREVVVVLTDGKQAVATSACRVNIPRGQCSHAAFAVLHFDKEMIDVGRRYKVEVRDRLTDIVMGWQWVRFFNEYCGSSHVTDIVIPAYGGVEPGFSTMLYKSFSASCYTYHQVKFNFTLSVKEGELPFIPEMELRLYYPDETIESRFVKPGPVADDAYPDGTLYGVSAPVRITSTKRGCAMPNL